MSVLPSSSRNFGLDLIRAAAIALVLISHLDVPLSLLFRQPVLQPLFHKVFGFYGVEVFFVLSGYLMCPIFERVLASPVGRWREFRVYIIRRWMRTLPLYYLALAIHIIFPLTAFTWEEIWPFFFFLQNLWWRMTGGVFFLVSWSLTIEEFFYLVFPLGALLLAAFGANNPRQILLRISIVSICLGLLLRLVTYDPDVLWDDEVRRVTLLRLDSLAYGVFVFLIRPRLLTANQLVLLLLTLGLAIINTTLLFYDTGAICDLLRKTVLFSSTSLMLALVIAKAANAKKGSGFFSFLVTQTSLYSYSLYLFHWPLFQFANTTIVSFQESPLCLVFVALFLCYVCGFVTYKFIEEPIMRLRPKHFGPQDRVPHSIDKSEISE